MEVPLPETDHDETDDETDDEDYEEEEEEDNGDGADVDVLSANNGSQEVVIIDGPVSDNAAIEPTAASQRESKGRENTYKKGIGTASLKGDVDGEYGELNRGEVDGLFCPICFEAWSSGGDHHISCLPCGHIYGLSCIKKWLNRRGSYPGCPQCKKHCRIKDIRLLYATRIVAIDGALQKTVQLLEAKCASLEKQVADSSKKEAEWKKREVDMCKLWSKKEAEWKKKEANLGKEIQDLDGRARDLKILLEDAERRASGSCASSLNNPEKPAPGNFAVPNFHCQGPSNRFRMQKDFKINEARLFDFESSSQIYIVARRLPGLGGKHVLTKVSLLSSHDSEDIWLHENTKAVKDLQISPHARLVLVASLGKKLSVFSTESNNTVLTYNLPADAWSCSWDICSSHYAYAGLQNGTVLQFDMRHTARHVESLNGLTCNPVHTLYSLSPESSPSAGTRSVLTASSLGLCQWNFGGSEERPFLIPESDRQGVCISLANCKSSNNIVATYRPKIEMPDGLNITQPTHAAPGQGTLGSHVLYTKTGLGYQKTGAACAYVSDVRLPKSVVIDGVYRNSVFASGDESRGDLVLQELPSLMAVDHVKPQSNLIRDVHYTRHLDSGLVSCLSGDSLQLFTAKLL